MCLGVGGKGRTLPANQSERGKSRLVDRIPADVRGDFFGLDFIGRI